MKLSELKPNQKGIITAVACERKLKRRLIDMGLIVGTQLAVIKLAPMGDPMEISLRGYNLALRKADAAYVEMDMIKSEVQI